MDSLQGGLGGAIEERGLEEKGDDKNDGNDKNDVVKKALPRCNHQDDAAMTEMTRMTGCTVDPFTKSKSPSFREVSDFRTLPGSSDTNLGLQTNSSFLSFLSFPSLRAAGRALRIFAVMFRHSCHLDGRNFLEGPGVRRFCHSWGCDF